MDLAGPNLGLGGARGSEPFGGLDLHLLDTADKILHLWHLILLSEAGLGGGAYEMAPSEIFFQNWSQNYQLLLDFSPGGSYYDYSCAQNYSTPLAFPHDFYRNKSCNIDCCVNSMLPINQNMIVSQGLEVD